VRALPVELAAPHAPVVRPGLAPARCILRLLDLCGACRPERRIAEGTACQPDLRDDKPGPGEGLQLVHDAPLFDEECIVSPPPGEFPVPGEEDPSLGTGTGEEDRVLARVALRHPGCAHRIVAHEPQVPAEGAEHPVRKEPGLPGLFTHWPGHRVDAPRTACTIPPRVHGTKRNTHASRCRAPRTTGSTCSPRGVARRCRGTGT